MLRALLVLCLVISGAISSTYESSPIGQKRGETDGRRQDMARILAMFTDYQSNNNGKMPQTEQEIEILISRYINGGFESCSDDINRTGQFCDPDGVPYQMHAPTVVTEDIPYPLGENPSFAANNYEIHYYVNARCTDGGGTMPGILKEDGLRNIAIVYVIDDGVLYCGDNQ